MLADTSLQTTQEIERVQKVTTEDNDNPSIPELTNEQVKKKPKTTYFLERYMSSDVLLLSCYSCFTGIDQNLGVMILSKRDISSLFLLTETVDFTSSLFKQIYSFLHSSKQDVIPSIFKYTIFGQKSKYRI